MPKLVKSPNPASAISTTPDQACCPANLLHSHAAGDGSADDGNERAEFEHAIAPGKFSLRQQFREQAIF